MSNANFEIARWDHYLLIASFLVVSATGLWLSWQWRKEARDRRLKARLSRRLAMELHYAAKNSEVRSSEARSSDVRAADIRRADVRNADVKNVAGMKRLSRVHRADRKISLP